MQCASNRHLDSNVATYEFNLIIRRRKGSKVILIITCIPLGRREINEQ